MNANQLRSNAAMALNWIGIALSAVALAKFFGVVIPIRGDVSQTALVAIACLCAK